MRCSMIWMMDEDVNRYVDMVTAHVLYVCPSFMLQLSGPVSLHTPPAQTMHASADVAIHAVGGKENITAKATFLR